MSSENNKRIAKNTFSMYIRMLFLMFISFYTSRVVLQSLGEEDFGIYNIVGGVVVLFTFVNGAMTTGTQRHLSYELGKEDGKFSRIFNACLNIHLWIAVSIVILAETIGLWFLNSKLNFPPDKMEVVNWVYQLSILTCIISIIRIPFNAVIIAFERMSFYAYIGILEGLLKLAIVYLLVDQGVNKLIHYSILVMFVSLLITIIYVIYSNNKFKELKYFLVSDKSLYRNLLSFSGWTILGSIANIGRTQGLNIIINIFYGVTLNAAIGIANQVNAAISQFVTGFQQAFNPQLTKAEASKDRAYQTSLINKTAKYSYLIILFFAVPILYNIEYLLSAWLGNYPKYTSEICFWIVLATLVDSISGPLWVTIFATGRIKKYQVLISSLILLNLPVAYLFGYMTFRPQYPFAFQVLLNGLAIIVRLVIIKKAINFNVLTFIKDVMIPISITSSMLLPILYLLYNYYGLADSIKLFIFQSLSLISFTIILIFLFGLNKSETSCIYRYIKTIMKHK